MYEKCYILNFVIIYLFLFERILMHKNSNLFVTNQKNGNFIFFGFWGIIWVYISVVFEIL